jgi:hypothetical protein
MLCQLSYAVWSVFKTSTILNDGQQQPVDNFAPRTNLKRFFKDSATSSGDSRRFDSNRGQAYFSSLPGVDIHSE